MVAAAGVGAEASHRHQDTEDDPIPGKYVQLFTNIYYLIEIIQRYYSSIFQIIVSLPLSFVFPITQKETLLSVLFQVSEPLTVKIWFLLPARKEVSVDVEGRYIATLCD